MKQLVKIFLIGILLLSCNKEYTDKEFEGFYKKNDSKFKYILISKKSDSLFNVSLYSNKNKDMLINEIPFRLINDTLRSDSNNIIKIYYNEKGKLIFSFPKIESITELIKQN